MVSIQTDEALRNNEEKKIGKKKNAYNFLIYRVDMARGKNQ